MASMKLTALDQLMPPVYTRLLLTFRLETADDGAAATSLLREGLAQTVTEVPLLQDSVVDTDSRNGEVAISHAREADYRELVQFKLLKHSDGPMESHEDLCALGMPMSELDGADLAPIEPFHPSPAPVFLAQVTIIPGGLILCACFHHKIFDGPACGTILRRWSSHCRALQEPQETSTKLEPLLPDSLERYALLEGARFDEAIKELPGYDVATKKPAILAEQPAVPEMTVAIFRFETSPLTKLKLEMGMNQPNAWVSTDDVLSALLWRHISRARLGSAAADSNTISRLGMAVDGRSKLDPPLPSTYLGNVNVYATAVRDLEVITSNSLESLAEVARAIRQSVLAVDDTYIRHMMSVVNDLPDLSLIAPSFKVWGMDLAITTWREMGTHALDWGKKIGDGTVDFVRLPKAAFDGLCIVLPRRAKHHDIEVMVGLKTECMTRLKEDKEFKKYASFLCE